MTNCNCNPKMFCHCVIKDEGGWGIGLEIHHKVDCPSLKPLQDPLEHLYMDAPEVTATWDGTPANQDSKQYRVRYERESAA